jgi:hypothetical protein
MGSLGVSGGRRRSTGAARPHPITAAVNHRRCQPQALLASLAGNQLFLGIFTGVLQVGDAASLEMT